MNSTLRQALSRYLLALADDEIVLGHRDSEWCGSAPLLEEDIAFANISLDEIGHALIWYTLLADLAGEDRETYPDQLVYFRQADDFHNVQLVELPNGDWAFSMLRQYLFDAYEMISLAALAESAYQPLAEAATKIRQEEIYHHRHTSAWIRRLCLGTAESLRRLQAALEEIWPYTAQLFTPGPGDEELVSAGYLPQPTTVLSSWNRQVIPFLQDCGLRVPKEPGDRGLENSTEPAHPSRNLHSPHLTVLLRELQSVPRLEPQARW